MTGLKQSSRPLISSIMIAIMPCSVGAVIRIDGEHGPEYALTEAGKELAILVAALGTWEQRGLPGLARNEDNESPP